MMDNAFPIKKHNQQHLDLWLTHPCFFLWKRPFPHPLRQLHLGFNIIPTNPRLICYDVLNKVFITIGTGKQFLTDFNTVLFLIISQQMRHEFVLTRYIWSFSIKIWWQGPMLMPTSSATYGTVSWRFLRITAWTLLTWFLFVDVESRPGLGSSWTDILPSSKCLNHS